MPGEQYAVAGSGYPKALAAGVTLASVYANGKVAADSQITVDATRGGVVVTASALAATVVPLTVTLNNASTSGAATTLSLTGTFNPTSGSATYNPISVAYTVNQTGGATGAVTGIKVNATETAAGGAHKLLDLQTGGVSRFSVAAAGSIQSATGATLDAILAPGPSVMVTGTTAITTATGFNYVTINPPTITDSSAVTITTAATLAIHGAPVAGGSVVITNKYALWVRQGTSVFDCTGLTTTVPALVLNGRSQSGYVAQVTGSMPTGFVLNDSSGVSRAAWGYAVADNDWITHSVAGDAVLLGDAAKFIRIGALGAANPFLSLDLVNNRMGIGAGMNSPSYAVHIQGDTTATARIEVFQLTSTLQAMFELNTGTTFISCKAHGSSNAASNFGTSNAGCPTLIGTPSGSGAVFKVGTDVAKSLVFGTNDLERVQIDSAGNVTIGTAALATNATDGFLAVSTCAGTPTGTPTAKAGRAQVVYDSTNKKWCVWNPVNLAWEKTAALT